MRGDWKQLVNLRLILVTLTLPMGVSCETRHDPVGLDAKPITSASHPDFNDPESVLKAYLQADTLKGRMNFVRNPREMGPAMEEYYAGKFAKVTKYRVVKRTDFEATAIDLAPVSAFAIGFDDGEDDYWYFLPKTPQGYRVDWRALGRDSMPLKRFPVDRPRDPVKFRVLCSLGNYYNYDFADSASTHYSLRIRDRGDTQIWGYLKRDAPHAKSFIDDLAKVDERLAILELQQIGPRGNKSADSDGEHVAINRIVSHSWVDWEE